MPHPLADPNKRWNMFARILEDILHEHGKTLGNLTLAGIHREKIRRLKKSLIIPLNFPMLNAQETEAVIDFYQFKPENIIRLRAAIVATAVERTLFDRIPADDALKVTEEVYPTILAAVRVMNTVIRSGEDDQDMEEPLLEEDYIDTDLASALDAIDRATLAFHMCRSSETRQEKKRYAQESIFAFQIASQELEEWRDRLASHDIWQLWFDEVSEGLHVVRQYMKEL
jgi:hypothetical protein